MRHPAVPYACCLLMVLFAFAAALPAQTDAVAGVPYTFDFGQGLSDIPIPPEISFTYSFTLAGGSLPPGLTLKTNGVLSGTPTTAGQYTFTIRVALSISVAGQSFSFDQSFPNTIVVTGGAGAKVSVQPGGLSFSFTTGAAASTQYISVNNQGALPREFSSAAAVTSGTNWLEVSGGGSIGAFGQGAAAVTVNPALLPAGTYVGSVTITFSSGGERFDVPVVVSVSSAQQSLNLSQTGLTFRAVAGGGAPPAQTFSVLNGGSGALDWTAATSTLSGGAGWLTALPVGGRSDASSAPAVQVQVRPAGLAAGDYYGQVRVSAAGVANSPQLVSVVLTVLASNTTLAPSVQPTGLIFVGQAGGPNPAAQTVEITNLASSPVNFSTGTLLEQGTGWLTASPKTGAALPGQPLRIQLQPVLAGLAAGVYRGELDILFTPGAPRRIDVLLIVTGAGTPAKSDLFGPRLAGGCAPAKLLPVFTSLGSSFTTTAAWPTSLEVRVVDDCGAPLTTGAVVLTFSSGDPLIAMKNLRDGRWTATWQAAAATTTPVTITAKAQQASPSLSGSASIGGSLQPNPTAPVIAAGGAVSAVSNAPLAPLAPGSLVRISGSNLAQGSTVASDVPLATQLNGTQVLLAARAMPLVSASDGQIVAVVPFDVPINATQQMIVQRATSYSVPAPVAIAAAQPAVFTKDASGKGAAVAAGIKPDGTLFVVDADNPVTAGDTVVISCAGLGAVDPPVDAGAAGPSSPASQTVNPVTVTIGGLDAVVASAVLAPDQVGVYLVTVTVPDGVAPAPDSALVVTVAGQASAAVTIAVK